MIEEKLMSTGLLDEVLEIADDNARMKFYPSIFGEAHAVVQNLCYTMADNMMEDYHGGYWDFYLVKPDGERDFVPMLHHDIFDKEVVSIANPMFGEAIEVPGQLAMMIFNAFFTSNASFAVHELCKESDRRLEICATANQFFQRVAMKMAEECDMESAVFQLLD